MMKPEASTCRCTDDEGLEGRSSRVAVELSSRRAPGPWGPYESLGRTVHRVDHPETATGRRSISNLRSFSRQLRTATLSQLLSLGLPSARRCRSRATRILMPCRSIKAPITCHQIVAILRRHIDYVVMAFPQLEADAAPALWMHLRHFATRIGSCGPFRRGEGHPVDRDLEFPERSRAGHATAIG